MFLTLVLLAGFFTTPPADMDCALSVLKDTLTTASPRALGMFFAEIGLEAAPGEIHLWDNNTYCELLMEFSDLAPDSGTPDSLFPLLEGLPLELLSTDQ
ncbi:MAG: hypothetical protein U9P42_07170 [Candidatus Fermentibacteria bacterium]|nr:hypothetical protein [Candidatus Fermentibacteria bacterium]